MHLTPQETDRLLVAQAADLARRRLSRGARLGATEATALIVDEVYEWAWDGLPLAEVVSRAGTLLAPEQVLPGVPEMVTHIQVDALFPSGTYLVDIRRPIGDPASGVTTAGPARELNVGRPRRQVRVTNRADRTVRITSHVDISEVNRLLEVDGGREEGWRPDIPAGSNIAWEPGESKMIDLVPWTDDGRDDRAEP